MKNQEAENANAETSKAFKNFELIFWSLLLSVIVIIIGLVEYYFF